MKPSSSPLLTDLYQLTMLDAYFERRMNKRAVFELFVRRLPAERNFLVACGLEQALDFLESLRFTAQELEWLERSGRFKPDFLRELARLRFTGDVHAMPEGTLFFPDEPILRVSAPLPEAQLVESRLINLVHFETLVASKAARCVLAAPGRTLVDFGFRRAHGAEAGILAARASYIAGFAGTATVMAGFEMGIPLFGTMAHSFVQAHDDEAEAFEHFAAMYPQGTTLLIDTYDTERAAHKVVALAAKGLRVGGVRLDSGDLAALSHSVRQILDDGGLRKTTIFASGNLDEYRLRDLLAAGAPIDGFGIGTALVTSADAPGLDAVYKLQEYAGKPRRKRSTGKATWPGSKQVYRQHDSRGRLVRDVVTTVDEAAAGALLLVPVMKDGRRLHGAEALDSMRARAGAMLEALPDRLRALGAATAPYPVEISSRLRQLAAEVDRTAGD